jgi:DNA-binding response OmpR family regulator
MREEGHLAEIAADGEAGLELARHSSFDLVILDVMLPKIDGFEVCRRLRASKNETPILMLTARETVNDRVKGLDAGADDYLTKPFALDELLARVRALGRRRALGLVDDTIAVSDIEADRVRRTVRRGGKLVDLTAKEYLLLLYFLEHPGRVLTREQILDHVWGYGYATETNVVDIYVHYLRRKLNDGHGEPVIATVRGVGYRFGPSA